jgi:hypoxanthine phosphoribosyltransferase
MALTETASFTYPEGTWNGMYKVKEIGNPNKDLRWVPRAVQSKHTIDFACRHQKKLRETELFIGVARGGLGFAQALAYLMNIKPMLLSQEGSYDEFGNILPHSLAPVIPTKEQLAPFKKITIADEIIDTGNTIPKVIAGVAANAAEGTEISTAILYTRYTSLITADMEGLVLPWDDWADFEEQASIERLKHRHRTLPIEYPGYSDDMRLYDFPAA